MKKTILMLIIIPLLFTTAAGQQKSDYSKIDLMLIRDDFNKVVDTCHLILATDSLNPEIYYKMGLAYQNILPDDKSFDCFLKAAAISPENDKYSFMLAKGYYNKGKMAEAKPLLQKLYSIDSLNWSYAYYLTSIYMQERRYNESLEIYKRFYQKDSANYIILDKMGFVSLRKGEYIDAIDLYNRSLTLNEKNVNALKNLSFLYASTKRIDAALLLLTEGIEIDPTDMDLYVRRAALNYSRNYTKRALDDYLKILISGDSTVLYLKRAGIGYSNNFQPEEAVKYLLIAYNKDSSDIEVSRYLGQNYKKLNDLKNSAYYYNHIINTLTPVMQQLSFTYFTLAEVLKADSLYNEAIAAYLKSNEYSPFVSAYMIIANLYDEVLNDRPKAIHYYQLFLDEFRKNRGPFQTDYIESVKKRFEFLKTESEKSQVTKLNK
jgi:tetratricopeptide (TPR) repeat protein